MRQSLEQQHKDTHDVIDDLVDDAFALRMHVRYHSLLLVRLTPIELQCLNAAGIPRSGTGDRSEEAPHGRYLATTMEYLERALEAMGWSRVDVEMRPQNQLEHRQQFVVARRGDGRD